MDGICTLANDKVYDQLLALLNSIEANHGADIPVCIYPYDDNIEQITAEIAHRPQVQIYNDSDSIERWDQFFRDVWDAHPNAHQRRQERGFVPYYRFGHHRPFCAFDGPFDRFLYIDADALLMALLIRFLSNSIRMTGLFMTFNTRISVMFMMSILLN